MVSGIHGTDGVVDLINLDIAHTVLVEVTVLLDLVDTVHLILLDMADLILLDMVDLILGVVTETVSMTLGDITTFMVEEVVSETLTFIIMEVT